SGRRQRPLFFQSEEIGPGRDHPEQHLGERAGSGVDRSAICRSPSISYRPPLVVWHRHSCRCKSIFVKKKSAGQSECLCHKPFGQILSIAAAEICVRGALSSLSFSGTKLVKWLYSDPYVDTANRHAAGASRLGRRNYLFFVCPGANALLRAALAATGGQRSWPCSDQTSLDGLDCRGGVSRLFAYLRLDAICQVQAANRSQCLSCTHAGVDRDLTVWHYAAHARVASRIL